MFTKSLEDFESLEFLNFAEKIQIGVSIIDLFQHMFNVETAE